MIYIIGILIALLIFCIYEIVSLVKLYKQLYTECRKAVREYDNFRNNPNKPPQLHERFIESIRKYVL